MTEVSRFKSKMDIVRERAFKLIKEKEKAEKKRVADEAKKAEEVAKVKK